MNKRILAIAAAILIATMGANASTVVTTKYDGVISNRFGYDVQYETRYTYGGVPYQVAISRTPLNCRLHLRMVEVWNTIYRVRTVGYFYTLINNGSGQIVGRWTISSHYAHDVSGGSYVRIMGQQVPVGPRVCDSPASYPNGMTGRIQ